MTRSNTTRGAWPRAFHTLFTLALGYWLQASGLGDRANGGVLQQDLSFLVTLVNIESLGLAKGSDEPGSPVTLVSSG